MTNEKRERRHALLTLGMKGDKTSLKWIITEYYEQL